MRHLFTLIFIAIVFNSIAQVPSSGLVGWYPFNGNANDESGNANNAVIHGNTLTQDRYGNANCAYNFNGTNNYMDLPNVIPVFEGTISYWFKTNGSTEGQVLVYHTNTTDNGWGTIHTNAMENHTGIVKPDANTYQNSCVFDNGYGISADDTINNVAIDQWYHVVVTYDVQDSARMYVNGNLAITFDLSTETATNLPTMTYIGRPSMSTRYFNGVFDDFGIWDRVLTETEIQQLYLTCNFSASINANSATTFCDGNSVTIESAHQGSPFTFQWLLNDSPISGETNYNYVATASGDYSLIIDSLGCIDTSNVITVTVNTLPTVSINAIPSFIEYYSSAISLSGSPTGGTFVGNGITGNSFDPNTAGLGSQTIVYNYTDGNSCSNSSSISTVVYDTTGVVCTSYDTVMVNVYDTTFISVTDTLIIDAVLTGITPPNNINTLKIYPNPASTHITIDNGDYTSMNGYTIRIENSLSQTVFTSLIDQSSFYIDLSGWSGNGLYFVQIIDDLGNTIETRKIIIQ